MLRPAAFLIFAALTTATGRGEDTPVLELHDSEGVRALDANALPHIRDSALHLLETSNFNSIRHRDILKATPTSTHVAYRKTVAGRYLLVSFDTPRRIKTIGGEVDVLEIVIGLNRPDYADSLFTIDREGRVVAHQKYSGADGVELLRVIEAGLTDPAKKVQPRRP